MATAHTAAKTIAADTTAEIAFLTRALKAPTLRDAVDRLAQRPHAESWSHEQCHIACLQRKVSASESQGSGSRIHAARLPRTQIIGRTWTTTTRCHEHELVAHL